MSRYEGKCPECGEWVDVFKLHNKIHHPEPTAKTLWFVQETGRLGPTNVIGPFDSTADAFAVGKRFFRQFNTIPVEMPA